MGGDPDPGGDAGQPGERAAEVGEAGSAVAVVRAEPGEVDVANKGHALGLDQQHAMAGGVAGHMNGPHARATELPARAVVIGEGIGAGDVVVILADLGEHRRAALRRQAVVAGQPFPAAQGIDIGPVRVHRHARQAVQAGNVVFVHMTEHAQVGPVEGLAHPVGYRRGIEHGQRVGAAHDDLIAVGILAVLVAEEDRDATEIGARRGDR